MPPGCTSAKPAGVAEAYQRWQLALASFSGTTRPERLPEGVRRTPLAPFRGQVARFRFSPDGRFLVWASNRADPAGHDTNLFIARWVE